MKDQADYSQYECPYSHLEKECGHELKGPEGYEGSYSVWCACGFRGPVFYLDPVLLNLRKHEPKTGGMMSRQAFETLVTGESPPTAFDEAMSEAFDELLLHDYPEWLESFCKIIWDIADKPRLSPKESEKTGGECPECPECGSTHITIFSDERSKCGNCSHEWHGTGKVEEKPTEAVTKEAMRIVSFWSEQKLREEIHPDLQVGDYEYAYESFIKECRAVFGPMSAWKPGAALAYTRGDKS